MTDTVRKAFREHTFMLEQDDGETWVIPGSNSTITFIADKKTAPFAIIHSRANEDEIIPPHFHKFAVDTWLVLQGKLNVWAGDEGRVLCAGDFAFVPPGVIHSYQVIEPHTEFLGIIHPSEWVEFFKAISDLYKDAGPFPSNDSRPFPKERFLKAIQDGHDVVPQFGHKLVEPKHAWTDSELPHTPTPYFLKAHRGPRYLLGGQTCEPLCLPGASSGKFSISYLEAHTSILHPEQISTLKLESNCIFAIAHTGAWDVTVGDKMCVLQTGDTIYVPPGVSYQLLPHTKFARAILVSDGPGQDVLFTTVGKRISGFLGSDQHVVSEDVLSQLKTVAKDHGLVFVNDHL